ncbi:hypothetical protein F4811DRAFT_573406 [Daldinia bambusicola]|nr:hypothetical protein F4811DRAFT_573406 [Daldinia bambusicola]
MDNSSSLPTASGPTANSPSDVSYSSGASHTSTRSTSPDSSTNPTTAIASSNSSQLASQLLELSFNSDIERNSSSILLNPLAKMDRNPFQSVNERRNKISTDRTTNNPGQNQQLQQQQQQQQHFQSQTLRSNMQSLNTAVPRSLVSSNWRSQTADETALLTRATEFPPFDAANVGHHMQHGSSSRHSSYTSPRLEQFPQQHQQQQQQQQQHLSSLVPYSNTSTTFDDLQLDGSYAYCYDRGNGRYTRLIPADMLPALKDIPAVQSSCAGMLVLPVPRGLPSNGRSSNINPVLLRSPANTPTSTSDNIQSRIDNIVASTPSTPTSLSLATGVTGLGPGSSAGATGTGTGTSHSSHTHSHHNPHHSPHHHHHHHHHHTSSGISHPQSQPQQQQQPPQRRPKIYCDKWVHEGVCAFTQQGCKYKHEMPFDKVTQHQLGLFHGFPAWWKKHQADLSRQRDGTEDGVRLSGHGGGGVGNGGDGVSGGVGGGERFVGRAGVSAHGHGHGHGQAHPTAVTACSGVGAGAGAGAGEVVGMASTPTTTATSTSSGLPSWRRGAGAGSPVEQKALGTGRSLAREARGGGVKNPFVSYSSPFGPIAPPARTSSTTPAAAAFTTDLLGSGQGQGQGQTHQNSHGVGIADAGTASKTGMGMVMGMAGGSIASNTGVSNTNPYSSLSSLDEEISGSGKGKPEEQSEKSKSKSKSAASASASGVSGAGSSGARLT